MTPASAAAVAAIVALALAVTPGAGGAIPVKGEFTGATAAGEPFSMAVTTKKSKSGRRAWVRSVTGSVPVTCGIAAPHSEEVGFPGPLQVGRKGRFAVTGVAQGRPSGDRVTTKVTGRFTAKREASGTLTYRGGFGGEFCSGTTTWTASRTVASG